MRYSSLLGLALLALGLTGSAFGQGILIDVDPAHRIRLPRPSYIIVHPHPSPQPAPQPTQEGSYKIKELAVNARLEDQVARVQVTQSFQNTSSGQIEVCFVFPLPYDGAIDQLTLMVDGKEHPAKLLEAKEARKLYEEIVRKNQDPALLEWLGTGLFKTSVFPVPPGAERKISLRYSQLCRTYEGLTDFVFPLGTAKYTSHPVEKVQIQLSIASKSDLKNVYSPTHSVEIKRPDDKHATVTFTSTNQVPSSDFRLLYDVRKGQLGTSVISYRPKDDEDGFFLMLTSPELKASGERPSKTVLFVVDRSGSMSGEKIEQAKGALKFVLNNLREGDLFNIIAYDSEVESWRPELQKFNDESRKNATGFVEGIYAGGSTNISGALTAAMSQLADKSRPSYVIFLTDGLPTVGESSEAKIVQAAESQNQVRARVFPFGVGYDVNSRLLDKLAAENFGHSEYVKPSENIEDRVSKFYNRISSPVMTDVAIKFDIEGVKAEDGQPVNRLYPKETRDLFAGEQVVLVGRYRKPGDAKVVITGKVGETEQKFDFPAKLVEKSTDETHAFIEKLWAVRRVGEIIDEIDLKGKNDELVKELVSLSTKHGILTPYTSFMADENTSLHDLAANAVRAEDRLDALQETEGRLGVVQRSAKANLQRAWNLPAAGATLGDEVELYAVDGALHRSRGGARRPIAGPRPALAGQSGTAAAAEPQPQRQLQQNVRTVGRKSFFRRGDFWIDSTLNEQQEKAAIEVERYSKAWFELIEKHGRDVAKYMTFDEPVILEVDGKAYRF